MRTVGKASRRRFLKGAAAAAVAAPYVITSSALGGNGRAAASNRITLGHIGVGGRGGANMKQFLQYGDVQSIAVCDADDIHAEAAKKRVEEAYTQQSRADYKGCDVHKDFRDLLARPDIDAVVISTPDHWHACQTILAAAAGKDIYCEKPLTMTIDEGKAVREAVHRYGRILQTGTHERSRRNSRFACELVRNGCVGKVHTIQITMPVTHPHVGPQPVMPVPPELDYDMWLGPVPWEPYTKYRVHRTFRYILDTSGGEVTDRGAHIIDLAQWGNGTDRTGPVAVKGWGTFPDDGLFNTAREYRFEFTYADGVRLICESKAPRGVKFIGDDGWVFLTVHENGLTAEPASLLRETFGPNDTHLYESEEHRRNFIDCVQARREPVAPVEVGHRTATMCHLANIAMLTGRPLRWDPDREEFLNDTEANRMLSRPQREPWRL